MAPSVEFERFEEISYEKHDLCNYSKSSDRQLLIKQVMLDRVAEIDLENCLPDDELPFYVADFVQLDHAIDLWRNKLPYVQPHYAVKCNSDVEVVKYLAAKGVNFDCASKTEIEFILNLGISAERIVYANPCKNNSYIRYANTKGINLTTVDNVDELYKLKKYHPNCGILIRIATDDSTAQCQLSTKFGCTMDVALNEILPVAKQIGLDIRGVAFHVGSGAKDFEPILIAVRDSREIFDKAMDLGFRNVDILDIGGGFEIESFEESSRMVNHSITKYFPVDFVERHQVRFIAEPGRFMVSNVFTLATHVIGTRKLAANSDDISAMIYINDGVYGNLNCILFDHQHPIPHLLKSPQTSENEPNEKGKTHWYSVWGPTCDGLDCVNKKVLFASGVEVGDWMYFPNIGAYTSVASTSFNGFSNKNESIYIYS